MIPQTIHYCWFGHKRIPPEFQKYIESWKRYLPDYEIIKWDESNFDIHCNSFVEGSYQTKKYAYVSDFARFSILRKYGGVYFDTDVEVIKPLDDILAAGPYMGEEGRGKVAAGLGMAMEPEMAFLREMEQLYEEMGFCIFDKKNARSITVVDLVTGVLVKHGFDLQKDTIQNVCGINIYPRDYFCPQDYRSGKMTITENTRTIHHYSETWHSPIYKLLHRILIVLREKDAHPKITEFVDSLLRRCDRLEIRGFRGTVKVMLKKIFRFQNQ